MAPRFSFRRSQSFGNLLILVFTVLGVIQAVRANLLEQIDLQAAASAGASLASAGSPAVLSELNTGEGPNSSPDAAVTSGCDGSGCNNNGPVLNLAPGSYIQFKVVVPPGFLARMDDTPDGGKVIVVISPEAPCPKCGGQQYASSGGASAIYLDGGAPPPPSQQGSAGNVKPNVQNYQESQIVQRNGQLPSGQPLNYQQQYASGGDQPASGQMYMKNNGYRKVHVGTSNQLPQYQQRSAQNFLPQPTPPPLPSFQPQRSIPAPPPLLPMPQRIVRPSSQYQQQPMPSSQFQQSQQPQYSQVISAPEFPQQQQGSSQYVQQTDTNNYQQQSSQFQSPLPSQQTGPEGTLPKFHAAVRSLVDGSE